MTSAFLLPDDDLAELCGKFLFAAFVFSLQNEELVAAAVDPQLDLAVVALDHAGHAQADRAQGELELKSLGLFA